MPASSVTVRAPRSRAATLSMGLSDKKECVLSAILLKQWRVPSTFRFCCALTTFVICSSELAEYICSVLYSTFSAQFFSLLPSAQLSTGDRTGVAINREESSTKVRLFTESIILARNLWTGNLALTNRSGCDPNVFVGAAIVKQPAVS